MATLDAALLRKIAPQPQQPKAASQARIIAAVGPLLQATLAQYGIDPPLRAAHFLAQTCEESDHFCTTVEYGDDKYFAKNYDFRADLGNRGPDDGQRFRGRGLIQVTGRANYQALGNTLDLPLLDHPELAADPATSLSIACVFWNTRRLNDFADQDDEVAVTWRVNGGFNGLAERRTCLANAKAALGITNAGPTAPRPALQLHAKGGSVASLQFRLRAAGDLAANSVIDGDFGSQTETAVRAFQQRNRLTVTGIVGPDTWQALPSG
jgi:putative chitinase